MTRMIFVTQVLDTADPVLGASSDLVRALAARCERLAVVANEVRALPADLDVDVVSLGKEAGTGRGMRGMRYVWAVARLSRTMPADALLAHMCPVYLNLASPIAKTLGVRTILWYAHPARSSALLLAERLADVVLTSLPGAYPDKRRGVRAIGQAIDAETFSYAEPRSPDGPLRLLALGRTSPSKGYAVAIQGIALARARGTDVRLRIVGPSTTGAEQRHRGELLQLIDELGVREAITLEDGVPRNDTRSLLRWCDAVVNTTIPGSGDKVVFEAMATGRLVLVSNPAFASVLANVPMPLRFSDGSAEELADRIVDLTLTRLALRAELGRELRRRVEEGHSLLHWVSEVERAVSDIISPLSGAGPPSTDPSTSPGVL